MNDSMKTNNTVNTAYRKEEPDKKPKKAPGTDPEIPSPGSIPEEEPGQNIEMPQPRSIPEIPTIPQEFPSVGYR